MADADKYRENAATAAVLAEAGIAMMRQNIVRTHPALNARQVDALLLRWLSRADDPIPGDVSGAVRIRERVP